MPEKRRYDRRHSIYYLRVFNQKNNELLGHLVDISEQGVMLVSEKPLQPHTKYALSMHLPDTINDSQTVDFEAETRWCSNDANPNFYDVGFELINPSSAFQETLETLIEAYMFKE